MKTGSSICFVFILLPPPKRSAISNNGQGIAGRLTWTPPRKRSSSSPCPMAFECTHSLLTLFRHPFLLFADRGHISVCFRLSLDLFNIIYVIYYIIHIILKPYLCPSMFFGREKNSVYLEPILSNGCLICEDEKMQISERFTF